MTLDQAALTKPLKLEEPFEGNRGRYLIWGTGGGGFLLKLKNGSLGWGGKHAIYHAHPVARFLSIAMALAVSESGDEANGHWVVLRLLPDGTRELVADKFIGLIE